ncbi:serine/threonine protein kinase [Dulcicalothrix desertica PCC 7102]|uniref:Serine/threonine protein kinase n=1 Tax=Dulcicalothrix desertica PCC 7102 TaxID=232991 RepID=A0A433V5J3_9CYAN|nr:serine/threonine-protein kinase [Dulcicalothrix desertica]RUT01383.1 serine/threonine protein kinase [Dulcicalothrix desertica PCC 7102]TWH40472.1 serine/threonine protein kinase [Dulcicalothrix desertica PCC 7102]
MKNIIGKILGSYEIQSELSRKAGKINLLAHDLRTQESVVIKLLLFNDEFEWDDLKLFEREVQILKNLTHPKLPRYIDSFDSQAPEYFALVQTYINSPTLEQHLKQGHSFTEIEVKEVARQILEILIYLHEQKPPVIHRDIKPSNILLDIKPDNIQVYLIDFGSVKTITSSNFEHTVVGTYGYMAPEQFGGTPVPASDLYSLGATLIHCCTGTHPADLPQTNLQIQFKQATNLSTEFANWLELMTQPSLDRRLHSARYAIDILEVPAKLVTTGIKPSGSKIELTKNADTLEILIPPSGVDVPLTFIGLFAIAWNAGIFAWTAGALSMPSPTNIALALFSLPFWGVGVFMVYWVIFCVFGKTRLRISNIDKVVYTPKHFTRDVDGEHVEVHSQLTIHAGVNEYKLKVNTGSVKSEVELEWLAHEVNDWLATDVTDVTDG